MTSSGQKSMRGIRILSAALLLTVLMAVVASAAPLWHHVTVFSVEGWKYDDVTVCLSDDADKLVVYQADSSRTILEFDQISSVRNHKGEDITKLILDPSVTQTEQFAPPPPAPVAQPDRYFQKPRFRSALSFQFGGSVISGNGYGRRTGHVMVQGSFRVPKSRTHHFGAAYTYQRIRISGSTNGLGDYGQHEIHALVGLQQKARDYRHVTLIADIGPGFVLYNYRSMGSKLMFSIYGGISLVIPTNKTNGLIFELNARRSSDSGVSGNAFGLSIGFFFMQV